MSECSCKNILKLQPQCPVVLDIEASGSGLGNFDHNKLSNRDLPDQHPISAITDLQGNLDNLQIGIDNIVNGETNITYDNSVSGLEATTIKDAIDELQSNIENEHSDMEDEITRIEGLISDEENRAKGVEGELSSLTTEDKTNLVSAINEVDGNLDNHIANTNNPHSVTKEQVGLGNCDNTSDMNKPVSTATQNAIDAEALLRNNADTALGTRIDNIINGTTNITYDNTVSGLTADTVKGALDEIQANVGAETLRAETAEGNLSNLTTTDKTDLVSAINELDSTKQDNLTAGNNISITSNVIDATCDYYGTCSSTDYANVKVVDCSGFALKTGVSIRVKFTNSQAYNGAVSMNVNSTGDIPVKMGGSSNSRQWCWAAGEVIAFTYDGTNWIMEASTVATTSYWGVTQLTDTINNVTTLAVNPKGVNTLYKDTIANYSEYSATSTYAVGDRIRRQYIYECTTAITTPESWNPSHWQVLPPIIEMIDAVSSDVSDIQDLIPAQASSSNQLADKDFVNSSISTNTANFIGTFSSVPDLNAYVGTVTNNDYAFVVNGVITDNGNDWASFSDLDNYNKSLLTNFDYGWVVNGSNFDLYRFDIINQTWDLRVSDTPKSAVTLNNVYNRYKAVVSGGTTTWQYEYTLNNSSFTASQWAAINSGATSSNISQISTNTNDISSINTTIGGYGDIVTHDVSEFATAAQGSLADTALQPGDLATVATSGLYSDLSGTPTIGNATLTIQKNSTTIDTFSANATSNVTVDISVPTDTNDLTNGAGYITGITSTDVTNALGYTPYDNTNPDGFISGITSSDVTTALGYTPYDSTNPDGFISGITSSDVTTALGYTPYDSSNPAGYTDNVGTVTSVNNTSPDNNGNVDITIPTVNDATLTITQNGSPAGTFTANASSDVTITITDTTYSDFVGADGVNAGSSGLVPAPTATDNTKYLKGDGTWDSIDALPSQTGNNGKFLTTNGSIASWATVDTLPSQSGQSGKFLTTDGTDASWAAVDALPSQTGQSGKYLTTNGTTASWGAVNATQVIIRRYS